MSVRIIFVQICLLGAKVGRKIEVAKCTKRIVFSKEGPHLNPTSASPPAPLQGERGVVCHVDVMPIGMCRFVIALIMMHGGIDKQMLIGAGRFVIALIMMYGCIGIPMLMNTGSIVVTRHITPLSPWRGGGGEASVGFIKIKIPPSRIDEMGEWMMITLIIFPNRGFA